MAGNSLKNRLFMAAVKTLEDQGWTVHDAPGGGSVKRITKGGESKLISIRTTQNKWIAFPRQADDRSWVTLSNVDLVVASSVDNEVLPKNARVHIFPAREVEKRFDACYQARKAAGHSIPLRRGIWISLYGAEVAGKPRTVGAGLGQEFKAIDTVPLDLVSDHQEVDGSDEVMEDDDRADQIEAYEANQAIEANQAEEVRPLSIGQAKKGLALFLGVPEKSIKIVIEG
ncbi:hypothetical protein [Stutzerimonas nitrititolerans]|uniref:hypothetical protein n=1 Tax=Stutzerimonas nitrititolerans TaxID=2482751 RepID=UPI0028A923BC|nr:hypothetical protein [Stutzerimonas nitrititolerans]